MSDKDRAPYLYWISFKHDKRSLGLAQTYRSAEETITYHIISSQDATTREDYTIHPIPLRKFAFLLHNYLYSKKVFPILSSTMLECGWTDGGCGFLAVATSKWLNAESMMVQDSTGSVQHCFTVVGEICIDGDGATHATDFRDAYVDLVMDWIETVELDEDKAAMTGGVCFDSAISNDIAEALEDWVPGEEIKQLLKLYNEEIDYERSR